jgi:hypothetical protein
MEKRTYKLDVEIPVGKYCRMEDDDECQLICECCSYEGIRTWCCAFSEPLKKEEYLLDVLKCEECLKFTGERSNETD